MENKEPGLGQEELDDKAFVEASEKASRENEERMDRELVETLGEDMPEKVNARVAEIGTAIKQRLIEVAKEDPEKAEKLLATFSEFSDNLFKHAASSNLRHERVDKALKDAAEMLRPD